MQSPSLAQAAGNIRDVTEAHPKDIGVPVAARAEMQLCRLSRSKLASYNQGKLKKCPYLLFFCKNSPTIAKD